MTLETFHTAVSYGLIPVHCDKNTTKIWLLSCENCNCNGCPFELGKHSCSLATADTFTDEEYLLFCDHYPEYFV